MTSICIWNRISISHWTPVGYEDGLHWLQQVKGSDSLPDSYKITITETAIFIYLLRCATHSTGCIRSSCPCPSPPPTTCCLAISGSHRQQSKTLCGWSHLDWSVTQSIYRNTQKIEFLKKLQQEDITLFICSAGTKNDIRDGERWPNSQTIQDKQHHINGVSVGQNHSQYEILV